MIDSELPFSYDKICKNVRHTLIEYDNYEANIPRKEIENSLNKMYQKQDRIREKLDIAESNAINIVDNWESFNQWFSVLKDTNKEMDDKEKDDETELGRLRLAFSSNANQLKSLEGDILACCRKLPETRESPQVIRLKSVYSNAKEYLNERSKVLTDISNELKEAEEKFNFNSKENADLTQQNIEFQKQLDLFSNSESFKLVQDARKHLLIKKEWSDKKSKLLNDIANSTKELENYLGNKDQSLRNLVLESNKQDQEVTKLQSKYNEMMQDIVNEDNISNTNRTTVMKQLHIELDRLQQTQLRKESNTTRSEVRMLKNKGDRLVSKLKMEISASSRTFSQSISKLTEPKPNLNPNPASRPENNSLNNQARFKNLKGKKKKNTTKSPKKKNSTTSVVPKEPPPRVYSLLELGIMKLQEEKEKYTLFLQSKFEPEINELKQFLERKVDIHKELLQQELTEILNADKRQRDLLMANKVRIQQRITEKDIEILSLNSELATFEDMIHDYQINCDKLEKKNEELKKKSLEVISPSHFIELRKNIESLDSFISSTKDYIKLFNAKMNDKIEASNQNKAKIYDIDDLKNITVLPRSKSMNDIHLLDQHQFTRKQRAEIRKERKPRTESSLSLIINTQRQKQKQDNQPKINHPNPSLLSPTMTMTPFSIEQTEKTDQIRPTKPIEHIETSNIVITKSTNIQEETVNKNTNNRKLESNEITHAENKPIYTVSNEKQSYFIQSQIEDTTTDQKENLTLSNLHINEFISNSPSPTISSPSISSIPITTTIQPQSNQPTSQKDPQEIIADTTTASIEKEEQKIPLITNVQTENPSINVTQPPSCQSPTEKPRSQLQVHPPVEQLHFIRKMPTFSADTRAFTIEARVSTTKINSNSNLNSPPVSPKQQNQYQINKLNGSKQILQLTSSLPNPNYFSSIDTNEQLIEQSKESYKVVSDLNGLQLQEGKSLTKEKEKVTNNQHESKQQQQPQLVLFSVTPMASNTNVNSVQAYQIDDESSKKKKKKRSESSSSDKRRFTIYTANESSKNPQFILSARRRALIQTDVNNDNNYSAFVRRSTINRVKVTKQKRRSSVAKVTSLEKVKVIKKKK